MNDQERIAKAELLFGPRPTGPASPEKQAAVAYWQTLVDSFVDFKAAPITAEEQEYFDRYGLGVPVGWLDNLAQHLCALPHTEPAQKQYGWLERLPYQPIEELRAPDKSGKSGGGWAGQAVRNHQEEVINGGGCILDENICALLKSTPGDWSDRNRENCREGAAS